MARFLVIAACLVACHRAPTPEQAATQIEALSATACACPDLACAQSAVDHIEALSKHVDTSQVTTASSRTMAAWAGALSCAAKLELDHHP